MKFLDDASGLLVMISLLFGYKNVLVQVVCACDVVGYDWEGNEASAILWTLLPSTAERQGMNHS
jgi:hypothetical protein